MNRLGGPEAAVEEVSEVLVDVLAEVLVELGSRRVSEVRESSGRLPPNAKY